MKMSLGQSPLWKTAFNKNQQEVQHFLSSFCQAISSGFLIMEAFSKFSFSGSKSTISNSFGNETYSQKLIVWVRHCFFQLQEEKRVGEVDSKIITNCCAQWVLINNKIILRENACKEMDCLNPAALSFCESVGTLVSWRIVTKLTTTSSSQFFLKFPKTKCCAIINERNKNNFTGVR